MSVSFHKNKIIIQIRINIGWKFVQKEWEERAKGYVIGSLKNIGYIF